MGGGGGDMGKGLGKGIVRKKDEGAGINTAFHTVQRGQCLF